MVDKEILKKFLNIRIQLINDEYFVKDGVITGVFESSIAFFSNGKTIYLTFDRVKEIRPLGGNNDK